MTPSWSYQFSYFFLLEEIQMKEINKTLSLDYSYHNVLFYLNLFGIWNEPLKTFISSPSKKLWKT